MEKHGVSDKIDEILEKTKAGTEEFRADVRRRLKRVRLTFLLTALLGLLDLSVIRIFQPQDEQVRMLLAFIMLLILVMLFFCVLIILGICLESYALNGLARSRKKSNKP